MQKLKKSIIFQEIFKKDVSKTLKKGGYKVEGEKLLEVLMAEKRYSIRIYDKKINDRLLKIYDDLPITFPNMNVLIVELIDRGLRTLEKEIYNKKENLTSDERYDSICHKLNEIIVEVSIMKEQHFQDEIAHKITHKLLGCNNAILVGMNNGKPKDEEYIEKGFYDKLPDRVASLLEKLVKEKQ